MSSSRSHWQFLAWALAVCLFPFFKAGSTARGEPPSAALHVVYPAGGMRGAAIDVVVEGAGIEGADALRFSHPRIRAQRLAPGRFSVVIPDDVRTGVYDVRAAGPFGLSSPRTFVVSRLKERVESQPNDLPQEAAAIEVDSVVNGRIEKAGDVDYYRFHATRGQRVVIECFADRIDSQLRAVLEVVGIEGRRIVAERGTPRLDPLIDFVAGESGDYLIKVHDLSFSGGANHFYRIDVDTGPRFEFCVPGVIPKGRTTRVALFGRNLPTNPQWVDVTAPAAEPDASGLRLASVQTDVDVMACHLPNGQAPVLISLSDLPVTEVGDEHRTQGNPLPVSVPCEASGRLVGGSDQAWFEIEAHAGEVFWLEAYGQRLGSPMDLDLAVLDGSGGRELAHFSDSFDDPASGRLPLAHTDPSGKWVAPSDGRFLVMLRNLIGGTIDDPRRVYRLSFRREEPDFQLVVVSRRKDQPAALNVGLGGRELLEVFAIRKRGMAGSIRVTASGLPDGVDCPEIWLGPGADRAPLVLSANPSLDLLSGELNVVGTAEVGGRILSRRARGGSMVWAGQPLPSARLTETTPLATTKCPPIQLTASAAQTVVSQEGAFDVSVQVERANPRISRAVSLSAAGLPQGISAEVGTIPAGERVGWISFQIPANLPLGTYSLAIVAETEALPAGAPADVQPTAVTAVSNAVTFRVEPSRISLGIDPKAPLKIGRGKIIQLNFFAERKQGFIGKTHVELVAPGGVVGLRGRGVTLVGQSDSGVIQIIANEDAPLGQQPFLRLEAVGTVEDRPTYRATRPLKLEIVE